MLRCRRTFRRSPDDEVDIANIGAADLYAKGKGNGPVMAIDDQYNIGLAMCSSMRSVHGHAIAALQLRPRIGQRIPSSLGFDLQVVADSIEDRLPGQNLQLQQRNFLSVGIADARVSIGRDQVADCLTNGEALIGRCAHGVTRAPDRA